MVLDKFQRPIKDVRISVTDKCNFRCSYCMPIEIFGEEHQFSPKANVLSFEEIVRLARLFVRGGAEKIRLTGGEPLLRKDLPVLIELLSSIPGLKDLTLTTNGWLLAQHARTLKNKGLGRITISLDTLDDNLFGQMNGRGFGTKRVLEGINAALEAGLTPVKVNVMVKRNENDASILELARYFKDKAVIPRFIEYMDVGTRNGWRPEDVFTAKEIINLFQGDMALEPVNPNYRGEVAKRYKYRKGPGEIGVISSISQPFCGDCNRARLSTDGEFVTCLFSHEGINLRDPMRAGADDEELFKLIEDIWRDRSDKYSEVRSQKKARPSEKVEMYRIGG